MAGMNQGRDGEQKGSDDGDKRRRRRRPRTDHDLKQKCQDNRHRQNGRNQKDRTRKRAGREKNEEKDKEELRSKCLKVKSKVSKDQIATLNERVAARIFVTTYQDLLVETYFHEQLLALVQAKRPL